MEINGKTCGCFSELMSGYAALFSRGHGHSGDGFEYEPPPFICDASNQKGCARRCVHLLGEARRWPGSPVPLGDCHSTQVWKWSSVCSRSFDWGGGRSATRGHAVWSGLQPQVSLHSVASKHANSLELLFF